MGYYMLRKEKTSSFRMYKNLSMEVFYERRNKKIFDESGLVPLWVPVGAFAASSWISIIRFRISKGGRS